MFRIAQMTDLHLLPETGASLYGVDTAVALKKVIRDMMSLPHPPELIIATGAHNQGRLQHYLHAASENAG